MLKYCDSSIQLWSVPK